jgi:hypothetical protein
LEKQKKYIMAAKNYTYSELLNKVQPSLQALSVMKFPAKVPFTQLIDIAENLQKIEGKSKVFWDLRKKLLEEYAEKDGEGKVITKLDLNGQSIADIRPEKMTEYEERFEELNQTKVKLDLRPIAKKNLENIEGMTPAVISGILSILR